MSTEYTPPTSRIWKNINNALDIMVARCRELRAEINQLKEDKGLLRAAMMIESELLRRSELEVRQLKKALEASTADLVREQEQNIKLLKEISNPRYHYDCPF